MRLKIKPERGLGKIEVEINEDLWKKIRDLGEKYKASEDYILRIILTGEFKTPKGDIEKLENEVKELEKKVYELEKKWAPLRYKAYGVSEDNKILAIELSGLLAENTQLKRFLRKKIKPNFELRKLIEYYIR
ncbi:hypothetical protein [Thermococcus paralvinellae]|uniref:Uncharacterized protein n=1 Tax=Thermococcus paralvinellae TaxID=582419 RepID=W0I393_9EURY|nr:hypothetical protein [Thermococcus paralvinellae]AHF80489.1 Hypothetical protein TES1_1105 [Thermococcus paralvinellae]